MKIYDTFTFFREYELLEWRLKMLYDWVDCFVIVEGNRTFQNAPKPFYFLQAQERYAAYADKIRYVPIKDAMPYTSNWSIEIYQRNAIKEALYDAKPEDIIALSDVDEFIAPKTFQALRENRGEVRLFSSFAKTIERKGLRGLSRKLRCFFHAFPYRKKQYNLRDFLHDSPVVVEQEMFEFYINWAWGADWMGPILAEYRQIDTMQSLRDRRNLLPMTQGGWHFSSMGGAKAFQRKMMANSDSMNNIFYHLAPEEQEREIAAAIEKGYIWWENLYVQKKSLDSLQIPHVKWFAAHWPNFVRA